MSKKTLGCFILLVGLPFLCGGLVFAFSEYQLRRVYEIPAANLSIPSDEAAIARGKHLVATVGGCRTCHGGGLYGDYEMDEPLIAILPAANLTPGEGGIGSRYTAIDWERSIRHGVGQDGRALVGVSAGVLQYLSDEDVADMIAYLQTLRPFNREFPQRQIGPLGRLFLLLPTAESSLLPALFIDHDNPPAAAATPAETAEYGRYLVTLACVECHKSDLGGGTDPGEGMNITIGGNLGSWTEAEFIKTFRSGRTPERNNLTNSGMPVGRFRNFTEAELNAIWLYIQSLPAVVRTQDQDR